MARGHGRILTSIWEDPDFIVLDQAAQWLYLFLLSQPNVNSGGLLALTMKRWTRKYDAARLQDTALLAYMGRPNYVAGERRRTVEQVRSEVEATERSLFSHALARLERGGFVALDHNQDELFICGFFEHSGIGNQPRSVVAAQDAISEAASFSLRGIASVELSSAVAKAPVRVPTGLRAQVLARDGWQCKGCGWSPGDPVPPAPSGRAIYRGLELDHVHPKSKGGQDTLDNLQVLCTTCNARKGARV
jgi:hypothetical protein